MLWTEEAVENLRRLALEGMSASVIAAALGAESRNVVIGKASRLGIKLSGGGRVSRPGRNAAIHRAPSGTAPLPDSATAPNAAVLRPLEPRTRLAWAFADAEVGEMRRLRFEDIRELTCRWPIGDPMSGDFAYCGLTPVEGRSYCAGHCRMAYRPRNDRGAQNPNERRQTGPFANSWRAA